MGLLCSILNCRTLFENETTSFTFLKVLRVIKEPAKNICRCWLGSRWHWTSLSIQRRSWSLCFLLCGKWDKPIPSRSSCRAIKDNLTWIWVKISRDKFSQMTTSHFPCKIRNLKLMACLSCRVWRRRSPKLLCKFHPHNPSRHFHVALAYWQGLACVLWVRCTTQVQFAQHY